MTTKRWCDDESGVHAVLSSPAVSPAVMPGGASGNAGEGASWSEPGGAGLGSGDTDQVRTAAPQTAVPAGAEIPGRDGAIYGDDALAGALQFQLRARVAEAAMIEYALMFLDRCAAESEAAQESAQAQQVARRATVRQIARTLGQAERSTAAGLNAAEFARDALPTLWTAFIEGAVDFARVRRVAQTAVRLEDQSVVERLDADVEAHARTKTLGELQSWLNRRVATLDTETHARLCQRSQADRWVRVEHHEDGTSLLEARIPTLAAATIEKRLAAAARGLDHTSTPSGSGRSASPAEPVASGADQRTLVQRQADLFCAWLQDGRVYQAPTTATICVMIPHATLTGEAETPGMAADRSWMIPAADARSLAGNGAKHQWYTAAVSPKTIPLSASQQVIEQTAAQGITAAHVLQREGLRAPTGPQRSQDPRLYRRPQDSGRLANSRKNHLGMDEHDVDVLSVVHHGYTPPARLQEAVIFRDGTCQAAGCAVPAERCDIDHRIPYHQGGKTTGENLQALCRSHHRMKSHGHPLSTRNPRLPQPAPGSPPGLREPRTGQTTGAGPSDHTQGPRTAQKDKSHFGREVLLLTDLHWSPVPHAWPQTVGARQAADPADPGQGLHRRPWSEPAPPGHASTPQEHHSDFSRRRRRPPPSASTLIKTS